MGGFMSKAPTPEPLSMEQILRVRARLESRKQLTPELKACFKLVLSKFCQELQCIQENTRMTIQCGPTVLLFASGSQKNQIHVFHVDGQAKYNMKTALTPQPLNMEHLLQVRAHLESEKRMTPELKACFNRALSEFCHEPISIQENARMTIQSGSTVLLFVSGSQENQIHVFDLDGRAQYNMKTNPTPELLSVEQLLQVRARLESQMRLTPELLACFNQALRKFCQEPQCVQENARMTIQSGPTVLGFVSGLQENQIHVFHVEGQLQYNITTTCWGTVLARACSKVTALVDSNPVDLLLENLRKISATYYGTQFPSIQQLSEIFQILRKRCQEYNQADTSFSK